MAENKKMGRWFECCHTYMGDGCHRSAFQPYLNKKLNDNHAWLFRCRLCGVWQIRQLLADDGYFGKKLRMRTYYPKNEFIPNSFGEGICWDKKTPDILRKTKPDWMPTEEEIHNLKTQPGSPAL